MKCVFLADAAACVRRSLCGVGEAGQRPNGQGDGTAIGAPNRTNMVVRVWLPDRPGALGLVASRIGALGADIVGIDVLERSDHVAVDEFAIVLPRSDLVKLLVREIEQVDGASVEQWRLVDRFPDPRIDALESVQDLCNAPSTAVLAAFVDRVCTEFNADWAAVLAGSQVVAHAGDTTPDAPVLEALAAGTAASPAVASGESGPDDLATATLPTIDAVLLVGRDGHPFRKRERHQLIALARIASTLARR
jgi:hypothetical protein